MPDPSTVSRALSSIDRMSIERVRELCRKLIIERLFWRFFPEFRGTAAYVDIETTGLDYWFNKITTIVLYDGKSIFTYVKARISMSLGKIIKLQGRSAGTISQ